MPVLDRTALEQSPLADLHAIASELSIDGYRRLRRPELINAILGEPAGTETAAPADPVQSGDFESEAAPAGASAGEDADAPAARKRRGRRGGRGRASARDDEPREEREDRSEGEPRRARSSRAQETSSEDRPRREQDRGRDQDQDQDQDQEDATADREEETVEGVVELLPNGSGFVRVQPPEPSDQDVYISAAQVKRCELVSGDRVAGPRRAPRRSERFASLVRIDTVNDRPASEFADGARFDDLPAAFPDDRFRLGSEDPTIKAIEWLTPFGRGSRVTIVGAARSGKSEAVRRLALELSGHEELQVFVALAGVRPEEVSEWGRGPVTPTAAVSLAASPDAQDHAVELVIDQARRIAARGAHAVVLVDSLDGLHPQAARKAIAAARKIVDGGSLTVIATASAALGGETTVIALDALLASTGRFPALDLVASGTTRPELLVGEAGAEAIARARSEAIEG